MTYEETVNTAISAMTDAEVFEALKTNRMHENWINVLLGKPTVSWGDAPPIMPPKDDVIQAIMEKKRDMHEPSLADYNLGCDLLVEKTQDWIRTRLEESTTLVKGTLAGRPIVAVQNLHLEPIGQDWDGDFKPIAVAQDKAHPPAFNAFDIASQYKPGKDFGAYQVSFEGSPADSEWAHVDSKASDSEETILSCSGEKLIWHLNTISSRAEKLGLKMAMPRVIRLGNTGTSIILKFERPNKPSICVNLEGGTRIDSVIKSVVDKLESVLSKPEYASGSRICPSYGYWEAEKDWRIESSECP